MVLTMGLGMQLSAWPDEFCRGLASRGFRVIRFDNRGAGLSTKMPLIGWLSTTALLAGATLRTPARPRYVLADMARDVVGLMDALDVDRCAHHRRVDGRDDRANKRRRISGARDEPRFAYVNKWRSRPAGPPRRGCCKACCGPARAAIPNGESRRWLIFSG
jgi:hypothetical protein